MVKKSEGIFICCDEPIKQYLRYLDQNHKFIIRDLGEGQLFIRQDAIKSVKEWVEEYLDQQTFRKPESANNFTN
ncbi:hypothetical protein SteCoe_27910 [Stentor coeruleus]|uniref:General transcription and DNA repair factor IIH subunit TFB5 n=1 Tax=Stentor coeruleus TaxID=5963 RepID=A0A1R2B9F5_9CILI|nr:hypothetical protein SteCoe_27910 [Stentor coeruleus]